MVRTALGVALILGAVLLVQARDDPPRAVPARVRAIVDPVAEVTRRIRSSCADPNPTTAFLRSLSDLPNMRLTSAQLQRALVGAGLSSGRTPPLRCRMLVSFLRATRVLEKRGAQVEMRRSSRTLGSLGAGAIQLDTRVKFKVEAGKLSKLDRERRDRLGPDAVGGYVRLHEISGIKVGMERTDLYKLYDLYLVNERRRPVAHVRAGVWVRKKWTRLPLEVAVPSRGRTGSRRGARGVLEASSAGSKTPSRRRS